MDMFRIFKGYFPTCHNVKDHYSVIRRGAATGENRCANRHPLSRLPHPIILFVPDMYLSRRYHTDFSASHRVTDKNPFRTKGGSSHVIMDMSRIFKGYFPTCINVKDHYSVIRRGAATGENRCAIRHLPSRLPHPVIRLDISARSHVTDKYT